MFKNSPAQIGGLQKFDFITEIGGQIVEKVEDAHVLIDRAVIGEVCEYCLSMSSPWIVLTLLLFARERC